MICCKRDYILNRRGVETERNIQDKFSTRTNNNKSYIHSAITTKQRHYESPLNPPKGDLTIPLIPF